VAGQELSRPPENERGAVSALPLGQGESIATSPPEPSPAW
jgi:hypothetical protein